MSLTPSEYEQHYLAAVGAATAQIGLQLGRNGYGNPVCREVGGRAYEPELELSWRLATGRVNELAVKKVAL